MDDESVLWEETIEPGATWSHVLKRGTSLRMVDLEKWGLGSRDLVPIVNFFSRVRVAEDGSMKFEPGNSKPGASVELRAEMNVLTILNTCQHPLDPNPRYEPKPVRLAIRKVSVPGLDDPCRVSRPENQRGFTLTERHFL